MRHCNLVVFMALIFFIGSMGSAFAEHRADSLTISPMLGGWALDSDLDLEDDTAQGVGLGYNLTENWGVEGAFYHLDTEVENSSTEVKGYLYRLDALYHLFPQKRLVPYLAAGIGAFEFDPEGTEDDTEFSTNFGAGIKYFLTESVAFRADVRDVLTHPENNLLYTAGLSIYWGGQTKEAAADTSRKDSDNDGVYDMQDQCPNTPEGVEVDSKGCARDSDRDGVADYMDECPDTPDGAEVDDQGCGLDSDNDGVIDYEDECPQTPANVQVDDKGCAVDSDGDGVADHKDDCENTPQGASVNEHGCWEIQDLRFELDKAQIKKRYYENLNNVVTILNKNPGLKVEIQGHTDSQGTKDYNQDLSEQRAKAVYEYLVNQGIDSDRLSYKGNGESQPVASNETAQGRAKNRRVELKSMF